MNKIYSRRNVVRNRAVVKDLQGSVFNIVSSMVWLSLGCTELSSRKKNKRRKKTAKVGMCEALNVRPSFVCNISDGSVSMK